MTMYDLLLKHATERQQFETDRRSGLIKLQKVSAEEKQKVNSNAFFQALSILIYSIVDRKRMAWENEWAEDGERMKRLLETQQSEIEALTSFIAIKKTLEALGNTFPRPRTIE